MKRIVCDIKIGSFRFYSVNEVKIESTYRRLIDTGRIVLPRRTSWQGKSVNLGEEGLIRPFNVVKVWLGYDDELRLEFQGFVRKVHAGSPVVVECEDDGYILKQTAVEPKSWPVATLKEVAEHVLPNWMFRNASIDDINLGAFNIYSNVTAAKVIQEIIDQYSIYAFFRGGGLYIGRPVWDEKQETVDFTFGYNIIDDGRRLKFHDPEEAKIRVKAINVKEDGTKLQEEVGDDGGTLHTINVNYLDSTSELKALAQRRYEALKKTGLTGSFEAFGLPRVKHGDIINFNDLLNDTDERTGKYVVEGVTKQYGVSSGYKQLIKLGNRYEQ